MASMVDKRRSLIRRRKGIETSIGIFIIFKYLLERYWTYTASQVLGKILLMHNIWIIFFYDCYLSGPLGGIGRSSAEKK